MKWMATSETDIKHELLSVREKLDIMHNVDITSKAYHKKVTENLAFLYQPQIWDTTHTEFLSEWLIHKKDENSKIIWEGRIDTDGTLCQKKWVLHLPVVLGTKKMGSSSTSCAWNKKKWVLHLPVVLGTKKKLKKVRFKMWSEGDNESFNVELYGMIF